MRRALFLLLSLTMAWSGLAAGEETPRGSVAQVIVVFKTHFDIGYTEMARDVVRRYRTSMIDQALEVCDQNEDLPPGQRFTWTIPGWPMSKIIEDWDGQTPERQQRVRNAFVNGRFVVHALPFTTHSETLELEDLVRGLQFAADISRSMGLELPRDAKMTDVPCHTWAIPTLLKHAGVDFLHLGCNPGSESPEVPMLFFWEGPDASRLLTMYSAENYGTGLVPPKNWPHKTWLALIHTGDNQGPPHPEQVAELLEEAKTRLPGVTVRIGRLSDFGDAILAEGPQLPVLRADMPDTWIHGPMASPIGFKVARHTRPAIATAEALDTLLDCWNVSVSEASGSLAAAYENSLLYGEHTWGGSLSWINGELAYGAAWQQLLADGLDRGHRRLERSWAEHRAYIDRAHAEVAPVLENGLRALAAAVAVPGQRIVVFNPLPWDRDGLVSLGNEGPFAAVKDVDTGQMLPVGRCGDSLQFLAQDVPSMGYRSYVPVGTGPEIPSEEADAEVIENAFFKVALDPDRGVIASLMDKTSGREWVDRGAPYGLGQHLYERFDKGHIDAYVDAYVKLRATWAVTELGKPNMPPAQEVPYAAASHEGFSLRVERGPVSTAALMEAPASDAVPYGISLKVTLYATRPVVDLEMGIAGKAPETWPEAGWICLPLQVEQPRFRLGRLASIIDPCADIIPGGNRHLLCLNSGMAVLGADGAGVGLCPLDAPLVSLDTPGCWRFSRDFVPQKPLVFVNLFNNQWTTNFRMWNEGSWTSRVRLWSFQSYDPESALLTPSQEARVPLQAAFADGPKGTLPPSASGLRLSRKGVFLTAFGPNPYGQGTLLRLWEHSGQDAPCRIQLPAAMNGQTAQRCNLRGEQVGTAIPVREGQLEVPLAHHAPVSLVFR